MVPRRSILFTAIPISVQELGTLGTWSSSNIKEAMPPYHPLGNTGIMVKGKEVVENEK